MGEEFKGDLFKLICLHEFEKHLRRNKKLYFTMFITLCFLFPLFMIFVVNAPFFMIFAGNMTIGLGTRKFFMNRQENILIQLRDFCKRHSIDIPEGM